MIHNSSIHWSHAYTVNKSDTFYKVTILKLWQHEMVIFSVVLWTWKPSKHSFFSSKQSSELQLPSKKTALTNKASACFNATTPALFLPLLPSPALHATLLPVCSHLLSAGSGSSAPSAGYSAPHTCEQGDSVGIPGNTGLGGRGSDRKVIFQSTGALLNSWQVPDNFTACAVLRGWS